jgi:hypothetical protein
MKKLHHATVKRAAKMGVTLSATSDQWTASHPDMKKAISSPDAAEALDLAGLALGFPSVTAKIKKAASPRKPKHAPAKIAASDAKPAKVKDDTDEDAPLKGNRSVVSKGAKDLYAKLGGNSGTAIAKALSDAYLGGGPGILRTIAKENGIPFVWNHLNVGQQRMCLGTVLKGKDNRNEEVRIEGKRVKNA